MEKKEKKKFDFFGLGLIAREHKGQRKQIWLLAVNTLKKTYKGALLGPAWAVIKPLFTLFIFWFAFRVGLRSSSEVAGFPRFIFMLTGYVPWFFMSDSIVRGSKSIRQNSQFVTKINFPVSNIMTFTLTSFFIVHIVLVVLMYITLVIMGYCPSIYNLQFFYYAILMFVFFLALSWCTAPLSAFSKDFESGISSIMTGLFWFSGIVWNTYDLENGALKYIMLFNPINYFVNGYRKTFLYNEFIFDQWRTTENVIFFAQLIFVIFLGAYNYKRLRKTLPDVL